MINQYAYIIIGAGHRRPNVLPQFVEVSQTPTRHPSLIGFNALSKRLKPHAS